MSRTRALVRVSSLMDRIGPGIECVPNALRSSALYYLMNSQEITSIFRKSNDKRIIRSPLLPA
jgi:hypothetical protein